MSATVPVVDAQVHAWAPSDARFPWAPGALGHPHLPDGMPIERLLTAMDAAGVDAALVVSPMLYGDDHRYAAQAARDHPGRLAAVGRVDPAAPDAARVARRWHEDGLRGVRIQPAVDPERWRGGAFAPFIAAAAAQDLVLFVYAPGLLADLPAVARTHPELRVVVDHLGLEPRRRPGVDPFARLGELLALAAEPNVAVKVSGVPALSAQGPPFRDVWDPVRRVLDAFGPARALWGSDFTRTAPHHTYAEALGYLRELDGLTPAELDLLLGGSLQRLLGWPAR